MNEWMDGWMSDPTIYIQPLLAVWYISFSFACMLTYIFYNLRNYQSTCDLF